MVEAPTDRELELAELEAQNGLRQFDLGIEMVRSFTEGRRPFFLSPSLIRKLQHVAVEGIESVPGEWRSGPVEISKSDHVPPDAFLVPMLIQEMCDYVNDNWHEKPPFHLSAYVMWRHNWIHPFSDGNGRTSRMLSYIVLSVALGYVLPGSPSIPEQIQQDRTHYFGALEAADRAALDGETDVSVMEELLKNMLANQLLSVINAANGGPVG
jgi:Fic family protein